MNGLNIGKAAVLALVASWAIYGTERVRIPVKKGGGGGFAPMGTFGGYNPNVPVGALTERGGYVYGAGSGIR